MTKPALLYYRQPVDGIGGLMRAFTIASRLSQRFRVVVLNSGAMPDGIEVPAGVELVQLPPLRQDIANGSSGTDMHATSGLGQVTRRETILGKLETLRPRVVLIESFPFDSPFLASELIPLLQAAKGSLAVRPFVICCVKDILTGDGQNKERRDDRAAKILDKYFDAVIVHSDPSFARLQEFFQPSNQPATPIYHSGFVVKGRGRPLPLNSREARVVVTAGSGLAGFPIYAAAVEAHRILWQVDQLAMTIIAGPLLPEAEWQQLRVLCKNEPSLELRRSVPDLGAEIARVRWAVCHCAYSTAIEVLSTGVAALLIPAADHRSAEQTIRLQRLNRWRAARTMMSRHLNGASLANGIHQLRNFEPCANGFNLDGAEITANLAYHLSLPDELSSAQPLPTADEKRPSVN